MLLLIVKYWNIEMTKKTTNDSSYLPVAWEYLEIIKEEIGKKSSGKIFYFDKDNTVGEAQGAIANMAKEKDRGVFLIMDNGQRIRIDRIITLYGKIGAAYDEYNAFANACMDCMGGYSKEELDDM